MNNFKIYFFLTFLVLISCFDVNGQGRRLGRHGRDHDDRHYRNYQRSQYHPYRVQHYRPNWAPTRYYQSRWVYFPRYNFYWDNWRSVYWFRNNSLWYMNVNRPPLIINVNLENERNYELDKGRDDHDSAFQNNADDAKTYPPK